VVCVCANIVIGQMSNPTRTAILERYFARFIVSSTSQEFRAFQKLDGRAASRPAADLVFYIQLESRPKFSNHQVEIPKEKRFLRMEFREHEAV